MSTNARYIHWKSNAVVTSFELYLPRVLEENLKQILKQDFKFYCNGFYCEKLGRKKQQRTCSVYGKKIIAGNRTANFPESKMYGEACQEKRPLVIGVRSSKQSKHL